MTDLTTFTIVKTDIKGFTSRSNEIDANEFSELLSFHNDITQTVTNRYGGIIFKGLGDSFLIAFKSATAAVQMAVSLQRVLSEEQIARGVHRKIEIRISIATGDVLVREGDYFGEAVNLAARIETVTPAGEVYVADSTRQAINSPDMLFEHVDDFRFKGISEPTSVFRAVFKYATRNISNVAVVCTDILRFTSLTNTNDPGIVENIVDFWDNLHRNACASYGGTLQLVLGDQYLLTFDDCNLAVKAVIQFGKSIKTFLDNHPEVKEIPYVAGMEFGDVKIYRTAVFGPASNRAFFAAEAGGQLLGRGYLNSNIESGLFITSTFYRKISKVLKQKCSAIDESLDNLARRMSNREIDGLWYIPIEY